MEVVKNIFFNTDRLMPNTQVKISYIGSLYNPNSEDIYIHYGFDDDWKDSNEQKMTFSELGYQANIDIGNYKKFNFCFKTASGRWDNNGGENYSFSIEEPETALTVVDEKLLSIKHFKRAYIWSKKVRQAVYKLIMFIPNIISGNYKRKASNDSGNQLNNTQYSKV